MASLHEIVNFTGGLVSNAGWSRLRNDSASRWSNLRVSPQGYLEPRKGNILVSDELDVDQVFVYKTLILARVGETLKWGRLRARDDDITFTSFGLAIDGSVPYTFKAPPEGNAELGDFIFLGNGVDTFVVTLEDVFTITQADPELHPFYLPKPEYEVVQETLVHIDIGVWSRVRSSESSIALGLATVAGGNTLLLAHQDADGIGRSSLFNEDDVVGTLWKIGNAFIIKITAVTHSTVNSAFTFESVPGEAVLDELGDLPDYFQIVQVDVGESERLTSPWDTVHIKLQSVIADDEDIDTPATVVSEASDALRVRANSEDFAGVTFTLDLDESTEANFIDIYQTERSETRRTAIEDEVDFEDGTYYLQRRVPYINEQEFRYEVPQNTIDGKLEIDDTFELVEPVGNPDWKYLEVDLLRSYAVDDSNLLYLSYFDGISDRRIRNFTDTIPLDTGGEPITGIKTLRERQLAVYTPHRIILIQTDPLAELTIVISVFNTGDRDEAVGCIAPDSLVAMGGYHYFLSANKRILRFGGSLPTWQSEKVQPDLEMLGVEYFSDGSVALAQTVGVAYKGNYHLSFNSLARPAQSLSVLTWYDEPVTWYENTLSWDNNVREIFSWMNEADVVVDRDGTPIVVTLNWQQGQPRIPRFGLDDIIIVFYADKGRFNQIQSGDDGFVIGDQGLDEIISLQNFVDNEDGTGTLDLYVDPSGIDISELASQLKIYIRLVACQPHIPVPNTTLIYDVDRDRWYEDGFGLESATKDANDRLYGVIGARIYAMYEGDSEEFDWAWQSNQFNLPPRTFIHNVSVRLGGAGNVDVTLDTEEGKSTRSIEVTNPFDYFSQRAGFNLRGETAEVAIHSSSKTAIRRIAINETI